MITLENKKHEKWFNRAKATKVIIDNGKYVSYYEDRGDKPLWIRIEGLDDLIDFEEKEDKRMDAIGYLDWYGRYMTKEKLFEEYGRFLSEEDLNKYYKQIKDYGKSKE